MNNIYIFCMNLTWVVFPLMVILIYEVFSENVNNKKSDLILDFCLFSAFYLSFKCSGFYVDRYVFLILVDTIILLSYLKKRFVTSVLLSLISVILLYSSLGVCIYIVFVRYFIYLILYIFYKNKYKNYVMFTFLVRFVSVFLILLINGEGTDFFLLYVVYYLFSYLIIYLFMKAEKIVYINMTYKELMKEKQLQDSLFKISHEIKNPIAVCKGYLDMYDFDDVRFKKCIPIIKSEINRTLNILQDFSSCNKVSVDKDVIDILMLLEDITDNFKLMFDNKGARLDVILDDDEIFINGDYNRLNQVFVNIIKNSIEAIDVNKDSYIKIYTSHTDHDVKIFVEDNGIGISRDNMEKIKEPFFTTKKNGTGLGTVMAAEIIGAHDGTIDYESIEGVFTVVTITLPLYGV